MGNIGRKSEREICVLEIEMSELAEVRNEAKQHALCGDVPVGPPHYTYSGAACSVSLPLSLSLSVCVCVYLSMQHTRHGGLRRCHT